MKTIQSFSALALALSISLTAAAAPAVPAPVTPASDYGSVVRDAAAVRKIVVKPSTKWVNVTNGETVTFVVEGKSFTYSFQTHPYNNVLPMAAIAPANLNVGSIRVFVTHDVQG
jgi:hypothetical protein